MLRAHKDIAVFPCKIIKSTVTKAEEFLKEKLLQIGLSEPSLINMRKGDFVILDFGRELVGTIRLLSYSGGRVRIRLGESVTETCAELGEKGACNDHSVRDTEVNLPFLSDNCYMQSAFRFVRVDALTDISIKAILAMEEKALLEQKGYFRCDDERINKIFEVATETLRVCIRDYIWDGVKRDRLVWIGDMHPETLGILSLYGAESTVEKSLDFIRESTPLPGWMNGLSTYSLWWLIILADYYYACGNIEFLKRQKDYIIGLLLQLNENISENGEIKFGNYLFDWPTHETLEEIYGVHALCYLAAKKAEYLCSALSIDESISKLLIEKLRRTKIRHSNAKQCLAMQVYARLVSASEATKRLTEGGAKGLSTFMSYYILSAIAESGQSECAVDIMKEYYGAMLDKGATTFWEDFNIEWVTDSNSIDRFVKEGEKDIHGDYGAFCYKGYRHSLCHGWSCGPIEFLMHKIAGFSFMKEKGRKVRIAPQLGKMKSIEAGYPTPFGVVKMSAKRLTDGTVQVFVDVPKDVEIEIVK